MAAKVNAADYRHIRQMARQFSRDLEKDLKRGMKEAADVGVQAVRRKLDTIPVRGGAAAGRNRRGRLNRGSLRRTLQRNTRAQVRTKDVRIVQGARGITGKNAKGLPRRLNGGGRGTFEHPVFGKKPEVTQEPWHHFDPPLRAKRAEMTRIMERALKDAVEKVWSG